MSRCRTSSPRTARQPHRHRLALPGRNRQVRRPARALPAADDWLAAVPERLAADTRLSNVWPVCSPPLPKNRAARTQRRPAGRRPTQAAFDAFKSELANLPELPPSGRGAGVRGKRPSRKSKPRLPPPSPKRAAIAAADLTQHSAQVALQARFDALAPQLKAIGKRRGPPQALAQVLRHRRQDPARAPVQSLGRQGRARSPARPARRRREEERSPHRARRRARRPQASRLLHPPGPLAAQPLPQRRVREHPRPVQGRDARRNRRQRLVAQFPAATSASPRPRPTTTKTSPRNCAKFMMSWLS